MPNKNEMAQKVLSISSHEDKDYGMILTVAKYGLWNCQLLQICMLPSNVTKKRINCDNFNHYNLQKDIFK